MNSNFACMLSKKKDQGYGRYPGPVLRLFYRSVGIDLRGDKVEDRLVEVMF